MCVCVGAGECFNLLLFSNLSADSNRTRLIIHRSLRVRLSNNFFLVDFPFSSVCLYTRISSLAGSLRFARFQLSLETRQISFWVAFGGFSSRVKKKCLLSVKLLSFCFTKLYNK